MTVKGITSETEEAMRIAYEIERLEEVLKQLKDHLKAHVDANGAFEMPDKVWDYNEAASWTFGGEALMEVSALIALEGKNPWELLTLPTASIRKLGWDEETLSRYGEKKIVRRFSSRKKEK